MRSNNTRFSVGLAAVVALGIGSFSPVFAGEITETFADGDTLTAAKVNAIKDAANETNTRLGDVIDNTQAGALKTLVDGHTASINANNTTNTTQDGHVTNLRGNVANGTCVVGAGDDAGTLGMVRVGPICVDVNQARADFTGCDAGGVTGCGSVVATSTSTGSAAGGGTGISWAQAQRACVNAGKRLLTPGEWMAGFLAGAFTPVQDEFDFVDAFLSLNSSTPGVDPVGDGLAWTGDPSSPGASAVARGGYMGSHSAAAGSIKIVTNVAYNALVPDNATFSWHFRCGR